MLSGGLAYLSRIMETENNLKKWAMTPEESTRIGTAIAHVLAKYIDLDAISRWQEEIALVLALGAYASTRVEFTTDSVPEPKDEMGGPSLTGH
jgi:hypothetical protein